MGNFEHTPEEMGEYIELPGPIIQLQLPVAHGQSYPIHTHPLSSLQTLDHFIHRYFHVDLYKRT